MYYPLRTIISIPLRSILIKIRGKRKLLIVSIRQPIGVNATRTAVTDKIIASSELIAFNKILDVDRANRRYMRPDIARKFDEISIETGSEITVEWRLFRNRL